MSKGSGVFGGFVSVEVLERRVLLSAHPTGLTPQQVRHAYNFDTAYLVKKHVRHSADGAGQTIAIIDAFAAPRIKHDLSVFDAQFGISDFIDTKRKTRALRIAQPDGAPKTDVGWALETSLDVEWAHAIAPKARILLVQALSDALTDLVSALDWARAQPGVSSISMSWGSAEFKPEQTFDQFLETPPGHIGGGGVAGGVTFFSSSGDAGSGTSWPAVSPNVVSVGGTTLHTDQAGNYLSETAWDGSGGGRSTIEHTAAPDVAYDADPATGFSIYDSTAGTSTMGWQTVGGTSAGAPQWAGLMAIVNQNRALHGRPSLDAQDTLSGITALPATDFHDITSGSNGAFSATVGTDLVTGRGTPFADRIIQDLGVA
jgi:subtilase family serine protease